MGPNTWLVFFWEQTSSKAVFWQSGSTWCWHQTRKTAWWFRICFDVSSPFGEMIQFDTYFFRWVAQPPRVFWDFSVSDGSLEMINSLNLKGHHLGTSFPGWKIRGELNRQFDRGHVSTIPKRALRIPGWGNVQGIIVLRVPSLKPTAKSTWKLMAKEDEFQFWGATSWQVLLLLVSGSAMVQSMRVSVMVFWLWEYRSQPARIWWDGFESLFLLVQIEVKTSDVPF